MFSYGAETRLTARALSWKASLHFTKSELGLEWNTSICYLLLEDPRFLETIWTNILTVSSVKNTIKQPQKMDELHLNGSDGGI